jgi:hypothetical protein
MIREVSGKLLNQFVTNLEAKLAATPTRPAAAAPAVPPVAAAPVEAGPAAPPAAGPATAPPVTGDASEPLDLLGLAGGSIYKRLVPVAVGVVAVGAVIVWLVARR